MICPRISSVNGGGDGIGKTQHIPGKQVLVRSYVTVENKQTTSENSADFYPFRVKNIYVEVGRWSKKELNNPLTNKDLKNTADFYLFQQPTSGRARIHYDVYLVGNDMP